MDIYADSQPDCAENVSADDIGKIMHAQIQPAEADSQDNNQAGNQVRVFFRAAFQALPEIINQKAVESRGDERVPAGERKSIFHSHAVKRARAVQNCFDNLPGNFRADYRRQKGPDESFFIFQPK